MIGRAVVVGGGFAALEIALALRSQRPTIPVTVISSETEVTYRPWLIRVPAGDAPPPVIPFASLLAAAGVDLIQGTARGVDVEGRHVVLDSGRQIAYGQLVVATGAVADRGRISGALENALFPCDLADATEFATRVAASNIHVLVVFGWERPGPGLEYAAWIAARRPDVTVTRSTVTAPWRAASAAGPHLMSEGFSSGAERSSSLKGRLSRSAKEPLKSEGAWSSRT